MKPEMHVKRLSRPFQKLLLCLVLVWLVFFGVPGCYHLWSRNDDLLDAAQRGKIDQVKALIAEGANIDIQQNDHGCTPLIYASANGYPEMVKFLLSHGANTHIKDDEGLNALVEAKYSGVTDSVQMLVFADSSVPEVIRDLFSDKDARQILSSPQVKDRQIANQLLGFAALKGSDQVVDSLVTRHLVDINFQDEDGCTALKYAVIYRHPSIVKFLLREGADPKIPDNYYGGTALEKATDMKAADLVKILQNSSKK